MKNVFHYVKKYGKNDFRELVFSTSDAFTLCALVYAHFERVCSDFNEISTVSELWKRYETAYPEYHKNDDHLAEDLWKACAESKRFGSVKVGFVRSVRILEREVQFAAVTFILDCGNVTVPVSGKGASIVSYSDDPVVNFVAFRGTDETIVGWKEDLNMTFDDEIPSRTEGAKYLGEVAAKTNGTIMAGGHSKGGNVAIYAAAKLEEGAQNRILTVYNFDGPGFHQNFLDSDGYMRIMNKCVTFVPETSYFGLVFNRKEKCFVVKSRAIGIFQHDQNKWLMDGNGLIVTDRITRQSELARETIYTSLVLLTKSDLKNFADTVYEILVADGHTETRDVINAKQLLKIVKRYRALDEERKAFVRKVVRTVIENRRNVRKKHRCPWLFNTRESE